MGITEKYSKILLSLVALFDTQSYAYALLWLKKKREWKARSVCHTAGCEDHHPEVGSWVIETLFWKIFFKDSFIR